MQQKTLRNTAHPQPGQSLGQPSQFSLRSKAGQFRLRRKAGQRSLQASPLPEAKPLPPRRPALRVGQRRGPLAAWCPIHLLAGCLPQPHRPPRRILPLPLPLWLPLPHRQQARQ